MDFLSAVRALRNGECEGITRPSLSTLTAYNYLYILRTGIMAFEHLLADDWELVNPTPKTEEVEVKRWECRQCGYIHKQKLKPFVCSVTDVDGTCPGQIFTELTGHYSRPVRRKVKRREELHHVPTCYRQGGLQVECWPTYTRFFAEWLELTD